MRVDVLFWQVNFVVADIHK